MGMNLWLALPNFKWLDKIIILRYVKKHHPRLYKEFKDVNLVR